jgi:choline kinase
MKAFLLAAGQGARLRPLTDNVPKCLLPICGKPLLGRQLRNPQALTAPRCATLALTVEWCRCKLFNY